jgi:hypothetical protein
MIGHVNAEVARRIDIFATALFHQMRVEDLNDLDLSYTPPLGPGAVERAGVDERPGVMAEPVTRVRGKTRLV